MRRVERVEPTNISPEQTAAGIPGTWTLLHFAVDDADAPRLAEQLAATLAGRTFRYRDAQLDW